MLILFIIIFIFLGYLVFLSGYKILISTKYDIFPTGFFIVYCISLALSDVMICMVITVFAALGHSTAAKEQAMIKCFISTLLIVVLPIGGMLWYYFNTQNRNN